MEPTKLFQTVGDAEERLLSAAFPDLDDNDTLPEGPALHKVISIAQTLCDAGDDAMCVLMRDWTWQGALAMLEAAGISTLVGGIENDNLYCNFLGVTRMAGGGMSLAQETSADMVPFPPKP